MLRTFLLYTLLRCLQTSGAGDLYRWLKMPQERKRFTARFRVARRRPLCGPFLDDIPSTTVHCIEEYLEVCRDLESKYEGTSKIVYRGQTQDHFLPGTSQVSLLPSRARDAPEGHIRYHTPRMLYTYREYLHSARQHHIDFVSRTRHHKWLYQEVMDFGGVCPLPEAEALALQPEARFLMSLFPRRTSPYLFDAALQHYGFPTLNLDVTGSPLVALYFALHRFVPNAKLSLTAQPAAEGGVIYLMGVPDGIAEFPCSTSRFGVYTGPRSLDLFEMTYDNDSRARRQYGLMLVEAGHVWADEPPHFNIYASYIKHRLRLSVGFWKDASTRRFIDAGLGGWLFPGLGVDTLFRWFRETSPRHFPDYALGPGQRLKYSGGRFEFMQRRRIVLAGSDASSVLKWLRLTWPGRAGWLEIVPLESVRLIAADSTQKEPLDIVVTCESKLHNAVKLQNEITELGQRAGRLFVSFPSGHIGDVVPRQPVLLVSIGGVPYATFSDQFDTDFNLQQKVFEALSLLTRMRYEVRMKPLPEQWECALKSLRTI